jgi:hypothetical protein
VSSLLRASPSPTTAVPAPRGVHVVVTSHTVEASRFAYSFFFMHAIVITPVEPAGQYRSSYPRAAAFPKFQVGQLPHCAFRGLLDVHSRYGLHVR